MHEYILPIMQYIVSKYEINGLLIFNVLEGPPKISYQK